MIFNFKDHASDTAIIEEDGILTYAELEKESGRLAGFLHPRSLVFCLTENSSASLFGYLAAINHGHVPLLLSAALDRALLFELVKAYDPEYLWAPGNVRENFTDYSEIYSLANYVLLKDQNPSRKNLHPDLALLLPTSGSTGSPKLVRHSYVNISSNIAAIMEYLGVNAGHKAITSLPMHYTYGLSVINIHLKAGASIVMTNHGVMSGDFWRLFAKNNVSTLSGVPYTWEMISRLGLDNARLQSLKYCDQAGGKLNPELQEKLVVWAENSGRKFTVMYGQTEASPRMGYLPASRAREKYGCMGVPIPGGKFRLLDEAREEITAPDTVGELVYEGPNVTMGYALKAEDLSRGDEWKGRLHTGDMARRDAEEFYYIVGRKTRFLKIYGNRVNLDDVEKIIRDAYPEADLACVGRDDELTINLAGDFCGDEIIQHISAKTGLNPRAFKFRKLPSIPRSESGKIKYCDLQ